MGSIAMQPSGRGYDHGVSTFSPDGRLYQVEYARESVKRGTTTVGLVYKDGVVLIVDKRVQSKLGNQRFLVEMKNGKSKQLQTHQNNNLRLSLNVNS